MDKFIQELQLGYLDVPSLSLTRDLEQTTLWLQKSISILVEILTDESIYTYMIALSQRERKNRIKACQEKYRIYTNSNQLLTLYILTALKTTELVFQKIW